MCLAIGFPRTVAARVPLYFGAVRFEHTVFALPFAYIGMVLAANGWPGTEVFIWITAAMASNRLVHRREDAANERTANRHLPRGLLLPWEMVALILASTVVFFVAAWQLNTLALVLAPVAAGYVVLYSFAKYNTWRTLRPRLGRRPCPRRDLDSRYRQFGAGSGISGGGGCGMGRRLRCNVLLHRR